MRAVIAKILRFFARNVLQKYQPDVVGVTGSIGKTSAKEAIFTVLSSEFRVRKTEKNYNNELGLPLTVLGLETGGRNPFSWLMVMVRAAKLWLLRSVNYPEILILEMGADRPGDIKYLTDFVPCTVGVVTGVAPVHIEFFQHLEHIAKEKNTLVKSLGREGTAVLNADDELVRAMAEGLKAKVITYGFSEHASLRAYEERVSGQDLSLKDGVEAIRGLSFKVSYGGSTVPVFLPSVVGRHSVNAALAAIAVGVACGINLVRISENLKQYRPPKGRMNLIDGIKYTLIIDDTYNSSPIPALAALDVLHEIQLPTGRHKFAVLGDMLELGGYTEKAHLEVGRKVAELRIDYLVTVGEKSQSTANAARGAGMSPDRIYSFDNSREAGKFLQDRVEQGDLILVKGSQGMRMERIVKELMAEPLRAAELLCRQEGKWLQ
ncbi:UDP-N-acetylmuramoyl-tripeptide--D-alanyl-D-alanine ligase [Candidatus Falkowbacteria bacterium]|nr:UDP-N-acetylmuramoyl-tripeptide--D-alanyl-D-alanine ligase [Candidatus Falkowbacteria bacterium]